jgi:hypothetical protein
VDTGHERITVKKRWIAAAAALLAVVVFTAGCGKEEDARQYIETIGVVITSNLESLFNELYVYPAVPYETETDITDKAGSLFSEEMGKNLIKNTGSVKRAGSCGVTIEKAAAYNVLARDGDGSVYIYERVAFINADHAVISRDESLRLVIYHNGGGSDEVIGQYVPPGDAPDQPHVTLQPN